MKTLFIVLTLTLSGCALQGAVEGAGELRERYCTEANPVTKHYLKGLIKKRMEGYPEEGLCTDFYEEILGGNKVSE